MGLFNSGLLGDLTGSATGVLSFMSHPMESILFVIGGILLLIIVFKILD
jgi:hypothetical protein